MWSKSYVLNQIWCLEVGGLLVYLPPIDHSWIFLFLLGVFKYMHVVSNENYTLNNHILGQRVCQGDTDTNAVRVGKKELIVTFSEVTLLTIHAH